MKAAEARPSAANLVARLPKSADPSPPGGRALLEQANRDEIARQGEAARAASAAQSKAERRTLLVGGARKTLTRLTGLLRELVVESAPAAQAAKRQDEGWSLELGTAQLEFRGLQETAESPWGDWSAPAFEVIAHASLAVIIPKDQSGYVGRRHSLWYCDAQHAGRFQWFETAFMFSPLTPRLADTDPFGLSPGVEAAKAVWTGMAEFQVAWLFTPLDIGDMDDFIDRWAGWFAAASQGQLRRPSSMPERQPQGSWRR